MRVVDAIAEWFDIMSIRHYFGYAGGAIWGLMDALVDKPHIDGIQAKHEAHAVHMADVYYRITGQLAPVLVTKGPGLMNTVGAAASAMHDSTAVMIIAGSGSTHFLGRAGMQELYYHGFEDALSVFRPITKGAWIVVRPDQVIDVLNTAHKTALSGRPGPVFVQLPYDIQLAQVEGEVEHVRRRSPVPGLRAAAEHVKRTAELLAEAERPLLLAGGGVARSRAYEALRTAAEELKVPVVTTLPAKGVLPEDHPLSLGPVGRSGSNAAARATREADLLVAVGARFSDNHTGNWRQGRIYDHARTKIVHVDVDPAEIGRNYPVELGILSDARAFYEDLATAARGTGPDRSAWLSQIRRYRDEWRDQMTADISSPAYPLHPARVCHEIGRLMPADGQIVMDVGDITQYAEPYLTVRRAGSWHTNTGMAEMGWGVEGAPAAAVADPGAPVACLTGDGAFLMGPQVVATAVEYDLPVVWIVFNNAELGIERKGSQAAYQRTHPWVRFTRRRTGEPYSPDYAAMAVSFGARGARIEAADELAPTIGQALESGEPWVIDVPIDKEVPTYWVDGLDRAYPDRWAESYPAYGLLRVKQ